MKNAVITMSDKNYFPNGNYFLKTMSRVDADFILYTPDIDFDIKGVKVKKINKLRWIALCQSLKLQFMYDELSDYENVTFCDFDTFFINDWHDSVFTQDFKLGVTTTKGYPQWEYLRSKVNGGVIFAKDPSILLDAYNCIVKEGRGCYPMYDVIWQTLEDPRRSAKKRHFRTRYAWWCDQIVLAAMFLGKTPGVMDFPCSAYNILNSRPTLSRAEGGYIAHLKAINRKNKKDIISG